MADSSYSSTSVSFAGVSGGGGEGAVQHGVMAIQDAGGGGPTCFAPILFVDLRKSVMASLLAAHCRRLRKICDVLTSGLNATDIDYGILIRADQGDARVLLTPTLKNDNLVHGGLKLRSLAFSVAAQAGPVAKVARVEDAEVTNIQASFSATVSWVAPNVTGWNLQ